MRRYYVYKITNKINNKIYIGKSNTNKNRWKDHLNIAKNKYPNTYHYVHKSINKYGAENFTYEVLEYFDTEPEAYLAETRYITRFRSNEIGMNLNSGGQGGMRHSQESIDKIRAWHTGFVFSEASKLKMSLAHLGQIPATRKFTDEEVVSVRTEYDRRRMYKEPAMIIVKELSDIHNVSIHTISAIVTGVHYKHIQYSFDESLPPGMRICTKCKQMKNEINDFYQAKKPPAQCKECNGSYRKKIEI